MAKKGIIIKEKINHTQIINEIIDNTNKKINNINKKIIINKNKNKFKNPLNINSSNKIKQNLMTSLIGIKQK